MYYYTVALSSSQFAGVNVKQKTTMSEDKNIMPPKTIQEKHFVLICQIRTCQVHLHIPFLFIYNLIFFGRDLSCSPITYTYFHYFCELQWITQTSGKYF